MKNKTLSEIAKITFQVSKDHGFEDEKPIDDFMPSACNNLHDEVSELHEAWRNNKLFDLCDKEDKMRELGIEPLTCAEEELADIIIRTLNNSITLKIDIESAIERKNAYNQSRSFRHGNKKC